MSVPQGVSIRFYLRFNRALSAPQAGLQPSLQREWYAVTMNATAATNSLFSPFEIGLLLLAPIILAIAAAYLVHRYHAQQTQKNTQRDFQAGVEAGRAEHVTQAAAELAQHETELRALRERVTAAETRNQVLDERLNQQQQELLRSLDKLRASEMELGAQQARLEETRRGFAEKEKLFKETSTSLKQEFEQLAGKVFTAQDARQQQSLQLMLNPFREQIGDFKKKVEEVYRTDTKERASLLAEIKHLQQASEKINEEAENLTKALKGDKKLQGNWGELVLERILEESGLRKDHEYFVQQTYRDDQGNLKRPDVLIRLPDGKDVIIDSKVTLVAYQQALANEDDDAREQFLKQHLGHLRDQVKRLADQNYDHLPDVRTLDFVLLFVPIESAFALAMQLDQKLFNDAFLKRIMIVSPTTLMMSLRIIGNLWRVEKQNKNAQMIADRAGSLYDKFNGLLEEMDKLGKQLGTLQKTYDAVFSKLATGRGNLVKQVEDFRQLGARVKKPIDRQLLQLGGHEDEDEAPNDSGGHDRERSSDAQNKK